jgi:hypothetical protein
MIEKLQVRICKCKKPFRVRVSSTRKLCNDCLYIRVLESARQMKCRKGKYFRKWLKSLETAIKSAKGEGSICLKK